MNISVKLISFFLLVLLVSGLSASACLAGIGTSPITPRLNSISNNDIHDISVVYAKKSIRIRSGPGSIDISTTTTSK